MQEIYFFMKEPKKRSVCPVSSSLDIWGDKWSLLIVRDLIYSNHSTYSDFLKSEEKIASNILASRLLNLENNGIISKKEHPESKAKVLYQLTEKGIDLLPLIIEAYLWGEKYFTLSNSHLELLKRIKNDKQSFVNNLMLKLKSEILNKTD